MKTIPFRPMRPGLTLRPLDTHPEDLPPGEWYLTYKLDDERAVMLPDGSLWNRQGAPLAKEKAVRFARHAHMACAMLPDETLDVALVGIRRPYQGDFMVLLDRPDMGVSDYYLRMTATAVPVSLLIGQLSPTLVSRLPIFTWGPDPVFSWTRKTDHVEGLIGRRANTPYRQGTSNDMFRSKK